jgi:hypothetical protein
MRSNRELRVLAALAVLCTGSGSVLLAQETPPAQETPSAEETSAAPAAAPTIEFPDAPDPGAPAKPPAATKPAAAPPKDAPEDASADAPAEKSAEEEEPPPGSVPRKPGNVGPTPGRFEPTEKVRADFDVSFPVDI